jgi:hypothetical protein
MCYAGMRAGVHFHHKLRELLFMPNEITFDLMIKLSAIAGAIYLIYFFIKDRYGKK